MHLVWVWVWWARTRLWRLDPVRARLLCIALTDSPSRAEELIDSFFSRAKTLIWTRFAARQNGARSCALGHTMLGLRR